MVEVPWQINEKYQVIKIITQKPLAKIAWRTENFVIITIFWFMNWRFSVVVLERHLVVDTPGFDFLIESH